MNRLKQFKIFCDEILSDSSGNYKKNILEKYKHDENIKYYLDFVYSFKNRTGISTKKWSKFRNAEVSSKYIVSKDKSNVKDLLNYLLENNTGKDDTLIQLNIFLEYNFPDSESNQENLNLYDLLKNIITKKLRLGIDVKTINKIFGNFIPELNIQLAYKYFERPEAAENREFSLTTKLDGCRCLAVKENGVITFYSRSGQQYDGLIDLESEYLNNFPDNICLDGEIIIEEYNEEMDSKSAYKETVKRLRKDGEKHNLKMLVFDMITAQEFRSEECNVSYKERRSKFESLFSNNECKYFQLVPVLYTGLDTNQIINLLNDRLDKKQEGLMINFSDAPYQFKRSWDILKVKKMDRIELPIIGYEEGTGSNKGKLGAFICKYRDNEVKVGSGYTKEQRERFWEDPESYINQIISVQYFEETVNSSTGKPSLRFPVFVDFRNEGF